MYKVFLNQPIKVFFIGIGGISMSGLAQILYNNNFKVSGSDMRSSDVTDKLKNSGINVHIPQAKENISPDCDLVVYTAAIHPDNPEFMQAKEYGIPMITRANLLGDIMESYTRSIAIAGTHGKTTTTSMVSEILLQRDLDPTISIGGILPSIGSNFKMGGSDIFVTEACEYTNSFLSFFPKYNIILNVEEDHMDFFKDINDIRNSFKKFASNTKSDGVLFINGNIENISEITSSSNCKVISFGMDDSFDCHPYDVTFKNGFASFYPVYNNKQYDIISLSVPGKHNVENALGVIALCLEMGIPYDMIQSGLKIFSGAERRFQLKGSIGDVTIVDDYAHHPTEIAATISAAREFHPDHLTIIFQPHTYSRTKAFLNDFAASLSSADTIVLAEIYAARETDTLGISSENLYNALKELGSDVHYFKSFEEIKKCLKKNYMHSGMLITMGAGNVNIVGEELLAE